MEEISLYLQEHYPILLFLLSILSIFIEISPLKLNPLSFLSHFFQKLLDWLGRQLMSDVNKRLGSFEKALKELKRQGDMDDIQSIRWDILDFSNQLRYGPRDLESFEHVFNIYEQYERLLKQYHLENGRVTRAMNHISKKYDEAIEEWDQNPADFPTDYEKISQEETK